MSEYRKVWVVCNNCGKQEQRTISSWRKADYCEKCESMKIDLSDTVRVL